jgi:hypothetical protein
VSGPTRIDCTPLKQVIKTLPHTLEALGPFLAVDNGSVRRRKKQRKSEVEKAIVAQVLNYANKSNNAPSHKNQIMEGIKSNDAPSDKKQIVDGIDRLPQIIGYDERRHMILPHSLLDYSQYIKEQSNMLFGFLELRNSLGICSRSSCPQNRWYATTRRGILLPTSFSWHSQQN